MVARGCSIFIDALASALRFSPRAPAVCPALVRLVLVTLRVCLRRISLQCFPFASDVNALTHTPSSPPSLAPLRTLYFVPCSGSERRWRKGQWVRLWHRLVRRRVVCFCDEWLSCLSLPANNSSLHRAVPQPNPTPPRPATIGAACRHIRLLCLQSGARLVAGLGGVG